MKYFAAGVAFAVMCSSCAGASTYLFQITGATTDIFTLDSSQLASGALGSSGLYVGGVPGYFSDHGSKSGSAASVFFYSDGFGGGLRTDVAAGYTTLTGGSAQMYTTGANGIGLTSMTYNLYDVGSGGIDHVTVSDVTDQTVYLFTVSGATTAAFALTSSQLASASAGSSGLYVGGVPGYFTDNGSKSGSAASVFFYSDGFGGGLRTDIAAGYTTLTGGSDQMYTVGPNGIGFTPSTYSLYDVGSGRTDQVTISTLAIPSAAPEPASWALMAGGFVTVGGAMRRRRRARAEIGCASHG